MVVWQLSISSHTDVMLSLMMMMIHLAKQEEFANEFRRLTRRISFHVTSVRVWILGTLGVLISHFSSVLQPLNSVLLMVELC